MLVSPRLFTFPQYLSSIKHPMASYSFSNSSTSELNTPRSSSPSSTFSRTSSSTTVSKRMSISGRRISGFNPLAAVDIQQVEAAMRMAQLDSLRGYAQDHYGSVQQQQCTDYVPKDSACGYQVIREPQWNKGIPNNLQSFSTAKKENILTFVFRYIISTRGTCFQKPHWPHSTHIREHGHTVHASPSHDQHSRNSYRQVPLPLLPQSQQHRSLLPSLD